MRSWVEWVREGWVIPGTRKCGWIDPIPWTQRDGGSDGVPRRRSGAEGCDLVG